MLKKIGEILQTNIRSRRKALRLTQAEFSASIQMPFRTFQAIESGESWPQIANLEAIAHGLGVHSAVLFATEAPEPTPEQALEVLRKAISQPKQDASR